MAETLTPLAQKAGVSLTLSGLDAEALVRGDHDELAQVFQNLIQNAIKYGRSGGKVEVRLTRDAGSRQLRYRVDVTDDGPGIAAQHLPRLTERFYRVNVAASREKGGTGPGPRHRQAHPEPPPRRAGHRLEAGGGVHLHGSAAGGGDREREREWGVGSGSGEWGANVATAPLPTPHSLYLSVSLHCHKADTSVR